MPSFAKKSSHLFVCGCPLSGTGEVVTWLNSSGDIAIGIERYQQFWSAHLSLPADAFEESRFFNVRSEDTWYDSIERFSEHYESLWKKWSNAAFIGDMVPGFWRNLPGLLDSYPLGRVIYIYRDPFSVARSYKVRSLNSSDTCWGIHRDVSFAIQEWNESVRNVVDLFNAAGAESEALHNRLFIFKYEDFITECIDRRGLNKFLDHAVTLPVISTNEKLGKTNNPEVLSEVEKDLIWTLLDTKLIGQVQRILENQRRYLIAQKINPQKPGRREWYHTADKRDAGIEYGEFRIRGCSYVFRGREEASKIHTSYAACIGSATTFGRFLRNPYPSQLETYTKIPFINLGIGGARPETYLANEALMKTLQDASLVVLEVMSARGYLSPFFEPADPAGNMGDFKDCFGLERYAENDADLKWLLTMTKNKEPVFVDRVFEMCFKYLTAPQRALIRDALINHYCVDIHSLVKRINKPIVALFMSQNQPYQARRRANPESYEEWSGGYPHYVDEIVLQFLRQIGVPAVVSRSHQGLPYIVHNWKTGEPAPVFPWQKNPALNSYYPSQEMHDNAFQALIQEPMIRSLCNRQGTELI